MAKRILLADDSITIQKVVELTFSDGDYEVTAVNNGNKAIQKLSEMRPDIILSDIIMPEKNGYEVCEFVKSHPEYRTIPVILLTGTFEPFDPDRADKAGCDAVVTKPFESQSLIHKVEELISSAKTAPTPAASAPASAPARAESPFAAEPEPVAPPPPPPVPEAPPSFATGTFPSSGEVFATRGAASTPTTEIPLDEPPPSGETRAFPKMTFEDIPPAAPPSGGVGETRAFPKLTFEDIPKPAAPPAASSGSSPWDEPAPAGGGETRAFPKLTFEDFQKPAAPATPPPAAPEQPSWDARPSGNFDDADTQPPMQSPSPSLWEEQQPAPETRAFPKLTFEDFQKPAAAPPPSPAAEELPFTPPSAPPAPSPSMATAAQSGSTPATGELSEDQIDKIARRVVQLLSDQVVRNIAWEVIPDLAETVVKERIRQLESE
jgi:CheY-like chemotaxis protein